MVQVLAAVAASLWAVMLGFVALFSLLAEGHAHRYQLLFPLAALAAMVAMVLVVLSCLRLSANARYWAVGAAAMADLLTYLLPVVIWPVR